MTTEEILIQIGSNIKDLRISIGMSQQDLAAMCNFKKSNMSRIESGNSNLTIGTLNKIATSLNVSIKELL